MACSLEDIRRDGLAEAKIKFKKDAASIQFKDNIATISYGPKYDIKDKAQAYKMIERKQQVLRDWSKKKFPNFPAEWATIDESTVDGAGVPILKVRIDFPPQLWQGFVLRDELDKESKRTDFTTFSSTKEQDDTSKQALEDQGDIFYKVSDNVNYTLKVIEGLNKIKRNKFTNSNQQGWLNDLQKQGVTKDQLELFKEVAKNGMTKDEITTSLLAAYSYAVEVSVGKKAAITEEDTYNYLDEYGGFPPHEETNKKELVDSDYYSNLTVPGGTNYTESEIKTPDITPSIKGHAQFSTDQGIGWFRSDDVQTKDDLQKEMYTQNFTFEELLQGGEIKQVPCG